MGDGTSLDHGAAIEAVSALESAAETVSRSADRLGDGAFGPDRAGRNYTSSAVAIVDGVAAMTAGVRAWSDATARTAAAVRASVDAAAAVDAGAAGSIQGSGGAR